MSPKSQRRRGPDQGNRDAVHEHSQLTPRPPSVQGPAAVTITDRTCLAFTGLEARPWKLALVALEVPYVKIGHRTICRLDAWIAAIDRASGRSDAVDLTDADVIAMSTRSSRTGAK